jgi:POT family proton-dependent oligopeptide transporter
MLKNTFASTKTLIIPYAELWDRLTFYGLQSFLILYLINFFGLADQHSVELYGVYAALSLGLCIFGGFVADKMLGFYYATLLGCLLSIIGNLLLLSSTLKLTYLGLSILVMGIGLIKPNNPNMLGDLYKDDLQKRNKAFSFFYLCTNLGAVAGPLIFGSLVQAFGYQACFLFAVAGFISVFLLFVFLKKHVTVSPIHFTLWMRGILLIILSITATYFIFCYSEFFGWLLSLILIIVCFFLRNYIKMLTPLERNNLYSIVLLTIVCIIVFAALLQTYASLLLFIDRYVDKTIFGQQIPTAWFSAIEPCCIFLVVPFLNAVWEKISVRAENKVFLGLAITGIAFLCFACAALFVNQSWLTFGFIFSGNALLAVAELCTIPIVISIINANAPANYKGSLMGGFYFSLMASGYLSSFMAKNVPHSDIHSAGSFVSFFLIVSIGLLFLATLFFWISQKKQKVFYKNPAVKVD